MQRRTGRDHRRPPPLEVYRLTESNELVSPDANTVLLIVSGGCTVRDATRPPKRLEAGTILLRHAAHRQAFDRPVARAIALLQGNPAKRWTVERLARAVGLSRAAFARRFAAASGRSPGCFLTELRLALARAMLTDQDDSLAELAARVGYASEFAFSRAFKRQFGVAPGTLRRLERGARVSPVRMAA